MPNLDAFFSGRNLSRQIFDAVCRAMETIGPAEIKISKSQIAFRRRVNFALVWVPEQYLHRPSAPLVLTLSFRRRDPSPRWKQVFEAAPGHFTHHLELFSTDEVDSEVRAWLHSAWQAAS